MREAGRENVDKKNRGILRQSTIFLLLCSAWIFKICSETSNSQIYSQIATGKGGNFQNICISEQSTPMFFCKHVLRWYTQLMPEAGRIGH